MECPSKYPYAYHNGEYCCATNKETLNSTLGYDCDGRIIDKDSLCCEDDKYVPCPNNGICKFTGVHRLTLTLIKQINIYIHALPV